MFVVTWSPLSNRPIRPQILIEEKRITRENLGPFLNRFPDAGLPIYKCSRHPEQEGHRTISALRDRDHSVQTNPSHLNFKTTQTFGWVTLFDNRVERPHSIASPPQLSRSIHSHHPLLSPPPTQGRSQSNLPLTFRTPRSCHGVHTRR